MAEEPRLAERANPLVEVQRALHCLKKTDARQAIKLLAELARAAPLSIGCYCENESACHRSILRELIEGGSTV